jgi:hypothetical protein
VSFERDYASDLTVGSGVSSSSHSRRKVVPRQALHDGAHSNPTLGARFFFDFKLRAWSRSAEPLSTVPRPRLDGSAPSNSARSRGSWVAVATAMLLEQRPDPWAFILFSLFRR